MRLLKAVFGLPGVDPDLLMHDDQCHFEPYANKVAPKTFAKVKHWLIDWWHLKNHKCSKQKWMKKQEARCKNIRNNMAESFNSWIRALNFFLNGLRPHSHRFWVREAGDFYNNNLKDIKVRITRRTNAATRKRPATHL